jgi:hypothetical protein
LSLDGISSVVIRGLPTPAHPRTPPPAPPLSLNLSDIDEVSLVRL